MGIWGKRDTQKGREECSQCIFNLKCNDLNVFFNLKINKIFNRRILPFLFHWIQSIFNFKKCYFKMTESVTVSHNHQVYVPNSRTAPRDIK